MNEELLSHLKEKSQGTLELVHTMDNYLFILDLEGRPLVVSDSLLEATEMDRDFLFGSTFSDFLFKDDGTPLSLFDLLLLDKKNVDLDLQLYEKPGGKPIDTLLISSSILKNFYKDEDYILILLADMREQRKTQMKLMQNNKLVSLGEMASSIAHEINNPLTVVMGQLHLLNKQVEKLEGDTSKIHTLSEKINTNFERISKIVKSLRTMSRNGEKDPMIDIPFQEVLDGVLDLSLQKMQQNGVEFNIEGDPKSINICCRETEILQVLLNLINNSIDSVLKIEDKWIKLTVTETKHEVCITVMDSGSGIDLDTQIRLFEPFFTTKDIGQGTGLGLSISRSLIEGHKGTLVYDCKSANTCFKISLPKIQN